MTKPNFIINVECMSVTPHKPHSWREGFLWYRKRVCGGVPMMAELEQIPVNYHKHAFKYKPFCDNLYLNPNRIVWICNGCGHIVSAEKEKFYKVLLSGRPSKMTLRG